MGFLHITSPPISYTSQSGSESDRVFVPEKDGIEFVGELAKRRYTGGVILVSGGDAQMLALARLIAVTSGLNVLGAFAKPLQQHE